MFELYFGAFDIVLYAIAFITAVMLADGICDAMEANNLRVVSSTISSAESTPDLAYVACAPSPQCAVKISVEEPASDVVLSDIAQPSAAEQAKPVLRVSDIRLYKLHKKSVVPLSALPFSIPKTIKRYMLRGQQVIRLEALQGVATVIS
ncbi:MAG: hypothetical protein ABG776_15280 [Cyanobacteria bacterium J06555_13]